MVKGLILKRSTKDVYGYFENLDDLVLNIEKIPISVLKFHINKDKNDFVKWIKKEYGFKVNIKVPFPINAVKEIRAKVEAYLVKQRLEIFNMLPRPEFENRIEELIAGILRKENNSLNKAINGFFE